MSKDTHIIDPTIKQDMCEALGIKHISDKTARVLSLVSKGIAIPEAYHLVTGKESITDSTKSNIKAKSEKYLLNSASMQKLAHNVVRDTLKMKPVEVQAGPDSDKKEYIYPSLTNRLAAASMVTDRTEPVKQDQGAKSVTNNIQVNIRQYDSPEPETQHIVDGHTVDKLDYDKPNDNS